MHERAERIGRNRANPGDEATVAVSATRRPHSWIAARISASDRGCPFTCSRIGADIARRPPSLALNATSMAPLELRNRHAATASPASVTNAPAGRTASVAWPRADVRSPHTAPRFMYTRRQKRRTRGGLVVVRTASPRRSASRRCRNAPRSRRDIASSKRAYALMESRGRGA